MTFKQYRTCKIQIGEPLEKGSYLPTYRLTKNMCQLWRIDMTTLVPSLGFPLLHIQVLQAEHYITYYVVSPNTMINSIVIVDKK